MNRSVTYRQSVFSWGAFGARLQFRRHELKMTSEQVADYLQIGVEWYEGLESGDDHASPEQILQLAQYFSCSTDYLLGN